MRRSWRAGSDCKSDAFGLSKFESYLGDKTLQPVAAVYDMIKKYRKLPVVIEAVQYDGSNGSELKDWSNGLVIESPVCEPSDDYPDGSYVQIKTLEGVMTAIIGDYIIKGVNGEIYPCKPDIFAKRYEEVI